MAFGRKYSSPPTLRAKNQRMKPGSWISQNGPASIGLGWRARQNTATKSAGFKPNAPAWPGWCGFWHERSPPHPGGLRTVLKENHRVPAPEMSFTRPNLPSLIAEIERLLAAEAR